MKNTCLLLLGGLLVACTKEDDPTADRTQLLTASTWAMTSYLDETTGQNSVQRFESCDQDDAFRFESGGAYREERGSMRCSNEAAGATSIGSWTAKNEVDSLTVFGVNGDGLLLRTKWKVSELTTDRLTLSRQTTTAAGAQRTSTVQLQKK